MTVIIVNDYDYVQGGATKVAIETANLLFERGTKVIFFCGVSNPEISILNSGIRVVSCNSNDCLSQKNIHGIIQGLNNKSANKKMKKLLNSIDDDVIIHIHGWTKSLSASFIKSIKKKSNVKVILTLHDFFTVCPNGGLFNYRKNEICHIKPMSIKCLTCNCDSRNYGYKCYRYLRTFFQNNIYKFTKKLDAVIYISKLQKRILNNFFQNKPSFFVYNPTLIENLSPKRVEAENNKSYLFVGRLTKDKGIDILCDVFSKTHYILNIVGAGSLEVELKQKYSNCPNIIFHGWQPQKKVYDFYSQSRALFVPSVYYEGAPLAIFEGLSFGIPCIVSNLCSGVDFITDETGKIFDPYNEESTIELLNKMGSNEFIKSMSTNAFNKYWENPFDENRYYNSIFDVYKKINRKE